MSHSSKRILAAVLCIDVVGSSGKMESDEEATLGDIQHLKDRVIDPCVTMQSGRVFKEVGDGFLIEFPSVTQAVQCATRVQIRVHEFNLDLPLERRVELRAGIHFGEVTRKGDDLLGNVVNIASRLEGLAQPGGICISEDIYKQTKNHLPLEMEDVGEQKLKKIQGPVHVWRWHPAMLRMSQSETMPPSLARKTAATWAERRQLELYVIANLSVGRDPHALPIDEDPALSRLRLLKDAIKNAELDTISDQQTPNMMAGVSLKKFKHYAEKSKIPELVTLANKWKELGKHKRIDKKIDKKEVRRQLASLRTAGVQLRNEAMRLQKSRLSSWANEVSHWRERVTETIKLIDDADAEWFKTLDMVPLPRILIEPIDEKHGKLYRELDFYLVKLDYLIQRYGSP